jgi:LacI family transcriptional regulator
MMTQPATGRAARLEDVAALAGVSTATASKALHNKPRISEETKQRVLDAAKQLNYSPNKLAQSLARGTTGTIGLVTSVRERQDRRYALPEHLHHCSVRC